MSRFDEVIERHNTNSEKYDFPELFGGDAQAIPMWVADMDFRAPDEVIAAVEQKARYGIWGYSEATEEYYSKVIAWFNKTKKWDAKREWIVKTPGVIFALSAAIRAFTKPGDAILIQQPVYHPFESCVTESGRKLVNNELLLNNGRYEIDFARMEKQIEEENVKMFILCSPHNPVGRVWSQEELLQLDHLCRRRHVFVVADEIHGDFIYPGHEHIPFASLSEEAALNCMLCTAPSKTFNLAGLQVSNIFIPEKKRREAFCRETYLTGYGELNPFALAACEAAYEYGEPWLAELLEYLQGNLSVIREFLKERLPQIKLIEPEGTYLVWLDFREFAAERGMDEKALTDFLLHKAHVWLSPGGGYGKESRLFMRLNMACPRSVIEKALKQMEEAARFVQ